MKNRIVALALAICILCMFGSPISVRAETADSYLLPDYDAYQRFMEGSFSALFDHRLYLEALNAYAGYHWCLDGASRLLGEDLSVERCTEILANMATLLNYQLEEGIVAQAEMDTTMTLIDYGVSAADIAADLIGTDALEGAANSVLDELAAAIGVANGALQVTAETIDELELLIQLAGDFSMQYDFFDTVYRYSDIPEMKEAAGTLLLAAQELMQHKLDMFNSVSSAVAKVEAHDIFLDQVAKELLADPDLFDSDAWLAVKALSNAYSTYSGAKLAFDITIFLGDVLFGTHDTYIRYNEMVAMGDIRDALLSRVEANPAFGHDDYENMDSNISRMKMALYVDARGEYCAYQMVIEDGKLAELTRVSNGKSIKDNYDASIRIIESAYDRLDELYSCQTLIEEESELDELDINTSAACYLPFIEEAIARTAYNSTTGSGFLYDIDSDDVDELMIINEYDGLGEHNLPGYAYSVYDIENGEVIAKRDKETLFYAAGGPLGYVGVANYLGEIVFVVYIDNGETGYQARRESVYTIYNPDNFQTILSASLGYIDSDEIIINNCNIDGKSCSYNDYLNIIDTIEPIKIANVCSNNEADDSMGLYELLNFIQELSGITPEQAPQITKSYAEEIANSVWAEYLKREQGHDWKIFEEGSLIKEGVEYYCYTLQANSKYGETDWWVFNYLFVNSVTGEYSHSLH